MLLKHPLYFKNYYAQCCKLLHVTKIERVEDDQLKSLLMQKEWRTLLQNTEATLSVLNSYPHIYLFFKKILNCQTHFDLCFFLSGIHEISSSRKAIHHSDWNADKNSWGKMLLMWLSCIWNTTNQPFCPTVRHLHFPSIDFWAAIHPGR